MLLSAACVQAQTYVPGGTFDTDQHWTLAGSPYIVQGNLSVFGAANPRLTIDPGVEVRFEPGTRLDIAWYINAEGNTYRGQLSAVGTELDPIVFTADNGSPGGWRGLRFYNASDFGGAESELEHCVIELADDNLQLYYTSQPDTLRSLSIDQASDEGLIFSQCYTPSFLEDVEISNCVDFPVLLAGSALPGYSGLTLSGNGRSRFAYTGTIVQDLTLDLVAYPMDLLFISYTEVIGGANPRLTLTAGSELRFDTNARLDIAWSNNNEGNNYRGQLTAVGTDPEPIVFTADNGSPGGWRGLRFYNSSDYGGAESELEHCVIELADDNLQLYNTSQPDTLRNLLIDQASDEGLILSQCFAPSFLEDVEISNCADFPVLLAGSSLPGYSGLTLSGNGRSRFAYTGTIVQDLTLDIVAYPMDLLFISYTEVIGGANPRLTLTAGSELRFDTNARLDIAWSNNNEGNNYRGQLTAVGTEPDPIVFTADNDTPGGWQGLRFFNSSDYGGATSTVEHIRVEYAETGLYCSNTSQPPLQDVQIQHCDTRGLSLNSAYPTVRNCGFTDNATAVYVNNSDSTWIGDGVSHIFS